MNNKFKGEVGERIAIGELAKYNIDVLLPMSDNLPFDFVIFINNIFYKCQVKSSFKKTDYSEDAIYFSLTSNNWYTKTEKIYNSDEVDIFILCDGNNIYLFKYEDLKGKKSITLRINKSKNNQIKSVTFTQDVIISEKRLEHIFFSEFTGSNPFG